MAGALPTTTPKEQIRRAIETGDIDTVRRLLTEGFHPDNMVNGSETGMILACRHGEEAIARLFWERGGDIGKKNQYKTTAFHYACKHLPKLAIDMIDADVDIDHLHKDNLLVPVLSAIEFGHEELLDRLLDERVKLNVVNNNKESTSVVAATENRRFLPKLIEAGIDVNWRGRPKEPVVHQVFGGQRNVREALSAMLLLVGAGANMHDTDGEQNLLPMMINRRHPEIKSIVEKVYRAPHCKPEALAAATKATLLGVERSLLDNPKTWWQLDTLLTELEKKGERLTVADLAAEPHAPDGKDYLSYALRCTGFGLLQSMFQAHGDAITPTQLIDLNGKATPLLNQIVEEKSTPDLFTVDFWRDHSSRELRQVFHALPERVQHSGLPYHQLMSWKKREERLTARVGGEGIAHG